MRDRVSYFLRNLDWKFVLAILGLVEKVGEQKIGQPFDLGDDALVGSVARHQPAEIGGVGIGDRNRGIEIERAGGGAGDRDPDDPALGIGERGGDRVPAPETWAVLGLHGLAGFAAHLHCMASDCPRGKLRRTARGRPSALTANGPFAMSPPSYVGRLWTGGRVVKGSRL